MATSEELTQQIEALNLSEPLKRFIREVGPERFLTAWARCSSSLAVMEERSPC